MRDSLECSLNERGMFHGAMCNSAEYRRLCAECGGQPRLKGLGAYAIFAGASPRFLEQAHSGSANHGCRITAFPSPQERLMLALTVQFGVSQLRVLLDLESFRTREMLAASRNFETLRLLLAPIGNSHYLEYDFALPRNSIDHLLKLPISKKASTHWLLNAADLAFVAAHLLDKPAALLVAGHTVPEDVTVTEVVLYEDPAEAGPQGPLH